MKKLLFITPHLSTGGMPQYLLWKLKQLKEQNKYELFLIEYSYLGPAYVVQRNQITKLLGKNFFSLKDDKRKILPLIKKINPDYIHLEEIPELFMDSTIIDKIYNEKRKYRIIETTHTSTFEIKDKKTLPDKFMFVCDYSKEEYSRFNIPSEVIDMEIPLKKNINRKRAKQKLDLDPSFRHILNVGLFTPNKNQEAIFKFAKKTSLPSYYHFVGNQAENFKDYWEPLMKDKPENCIIWGEREDVDLFYEACDIFLFPSLLELNPLCVKEALSWDMTVMMHNLPTYKGYYNNHPNVKFLTANTLD